MSLLTYTDAPLHLTNLMHVFFLLQIPEMRETSHLSLGTHGGLTIQQQLG